MIAEDAAGLCRLLPPLLAAALLLSPSCGPLPPPGETLPEAAPPVLRLDSIPGAARVEIDGEPTQLRTPTVVTALPAGEHSVALTLKGYQRWEKRVSIEEGRSVNLDVRLEPTATGSLSISSVPFQSWIFIDGRGTPKVTPATIDNLPIGTHTVLLRREGYEDWSQAVVVTENTLIPIKASLKAVAGMRGNLNVQTYPSGAQIVVDGSPAGEEAPTTLFNLTAGRHFIVLAKEGYRSWKGDVDIPEEVTSNLLVTLERSEPRKWGSAVITSTPDGAVAILDGVHVRTHTPIAFDTITNGSHDLTLQREGYRTWEGKLEIRPGEKTELHITLSPK